ncbi:hypothetical protein [Flavobacterium aquicola]|uniref:Uncharacterized protein n=1 Tax=Flavobacterium aquicola TaxID=1682742 RepID=A0A3E0DVR9_9FLAO|nr:hypothetical protein [Flavobacterium aquicola]REG88541.1 hypothetical protein C8P67_1362 [Flavobacterium aquicola]
MYKSPMEYTKENISEVMNKPIKIFIGKWGSDEISEEINGEIIRCTVAANPPFLPATVRVRVGNGERSFSIAEIKRFEDI